MTSTNTAREKAAAAALLLGLSHPRDLADLLAIAEVADTAEDLAAMVREGREDARADAR